MSPDTFAYVAELVGRRSAIRLEPGKEYLVESRLGPLAREHGLDVDAYIRRVRAGGGEAELARVVEAMTTNETSWFRDVAPFAALRPHVLPLLRSTGGIGRLRIWSAACSTGQEPYSILMALADEPAVPVDVVATDLNEQVLDRARAGEYSQLEVNRGLPAAALVHHFERAGAHWRVKADLRSRVQFRRHNLLDPAPPGPFDMVFCRNVLIYFDLATKRAVLDRIARALRPGGLLVLGAAETTLGVHDGFERVEVGGAVLHRPVASTPFGPPTGAFAIPGATTATGVPHPAVPGVTGPAPVPLGSPFSAPNTRPLPVVSAFAAPRPATRRDHTATPPASAPSQRGLS